jgi:outer membrane protein OmpA-like peptidoglycan-associated protein
VRLQPIFSSMLIVLTAVATLACGGHPDSRAAKNAAGGAAPPAAVSNPQTPSAALPAGPSMIPLRAGLKIVGAGSDIQQGDGQSVTSVTAVTAETVTVGILLEYSKVDRYSGLLTLKRPELATSSNYNQVVYTNRATDPNRIGTFWGPSSAVLQQLKTSGATSFVNWVPRRSGPSFLGPEMTTVRIKKTGDQPIAFPVLVNNRLTAVPAIQARGTVEFESGPPVAVEIIFSDSIDNPITLHRTQEGHTGDVTHIWFPEERPAVEVEHQLATAGRVEVYGIYFDLGQSTIKAGFESVLREISDALTKNPQWKVRIEGHTDNIGPEADNQALSERRAAAVMNQLVTKYGVDAGRLSTVGFGESKPKDTNETLIGRAQNRRVELVRR